jgi:hypothetical protein
MYTYRYDGGDMHPHGAGVTDHRRDSATVATAMATRSSTRFAVARVVVLGAVGVACFRMHVGEAVSLSSAPEPTAAHATELTDVSDSLAAALIKPTGVVRRDDPGLGMPMTSEHEGSLQSVRAHLLVVESVHRCSWMNISSRDASVARHAHGVLVWVHGQLNCMLRGSLHTQPSFSMPTPLKREICVQAMQCQLTGSAD